MTLVENFLQDLPRTPYCAAAKCGVGGTGGVTTKKTEAASGNEVNLETWIETKNILFYQRRRPRERGWN